MTCPSCQNGLFHCHGVLVVHDDGWIECSEDVACPGPYVVLHDFRIACAVDPSGCRCVLVAA